MTGQPHELPKEGQDIPVSQSLLPVSQGLQIMQYLQKVIMLSSYTKQTLGTKKTPKEIKKTETKDWEDVQLIMEPREMLS